jgi:deoxyribonuclease-4
MERYIGAHVSCAGGQQNAIKTAEKHQINSIQIMPSAPMRWATKLIPDEKIIPFIEAQKYSVVKKVLVHDIYLINLARKDKQKFHLSKMSLVTSLSYIQRVMELAEENGNDLDMLGVTFHPGSALDLTPEEGIKRISYGIDWIFDKVPGEGMLLLETSAGAGNVMGDSLEEMAAMRDGVQDKDRVGYVLDTQHMFVSGYDWRSDIDGVVQKVDSILGLDMVKAIHLNDSLTPFDSHKDRHANLGEGEIGLDAMRAIINHPKLKHIPMMLETPAMKKPETMKVEIENFKGLVNN